MRFPRTLTITAVMLGVAATGCGTVLGETKTATSCASLPDAIRVACDNHDITGQHPSSQLTRYNDATSVTGRPGNVLADQLLGR